MQETRDCSVTSPSDVKTHPVNVRRTLKILLVSKSLLQRSTNRLGTVERDIRTTRYFPKDMEVLPVD